MNTRLLQAYSSIEEQNKDKFLQNKLELDTVWGKDIWGVTLQIDLSEEVRDIVCKYQEELEQLEPENLFLPPRQFQHITFNQVVYWDGQYVLGTKGTWDSIADKFLSEFKHKNKNFKSFKVQFSKLIATTGGIIWCGFDGNDEIENLREYFLQKLPFPKETTKFNHIVHTTVVRYKNKLNNPKKVLDYLNSRTESVEMSVNKIFLRKELIFPSIKTEPLGEIESV